MNTFDLPPAVQARLQFQADARPVCDRGPVEEEKWWAKVWAERGLPDPATVTPGEFRKHIQDKSY